MVSMITKKNIYGKKIFIADLILTSIWAYFFSKYSSPYLLLLIPVRIALCFEMYKKSPWTLISAIGFLLSYGSIEYISKPFRDMVYILFSALGLSVAKVEIFSQPLEPKMEIWLDIFTSLWAIWLIALPLIVGICQKNLRSIQWKRKCIWIYFLPLTICFIWIFIEEGRIGIFLEGLIVSSLPIVYWSIYQRKNRSLIQLLSEYSTLTEYLRYAVLILVVMTIGLKGITTLKFIGLIVLPPLFYGMIIKSFHLGVILTRCCIGLAISGFLYWLTLDNGLTLTVIFLATAIILIVYVGITILIKTKNWIASLVIITVLPFIIIPGILGLNPYTVMESDHTRNYLTNLSVKQGVYVVEKYNENVNEEQPNYWSRKYGIRDRYGIIIPMKYDELTPLDKWGRYIITKSYSEFESMFGSQQYGVFDLRKRMFIINPDNIDVRKIHKIDDKSFRLYDSNERNFAILYLPGDYNGEYYPEAHIEPHFAQDEISVKEFIARAEGVDFDNENDFGEEILKEHPHAYKLIARMTEMGCEKSSPKSDLNYAKAIKEIIQKDSYYKGNIDKAMEDVATASEYLGDSGSQASLNEWTEYLRLIASIQISLTYDSLFSLFPNNDLLIKEYIAWHNLMEAMAYYQDYMYSIQYYRGVTAEKNLQIIRWLDYRREALLKELDIISGNLAYTIPLDTITLIKGKREYDEFFSIYHSPNDPYYYDPMWNEIKAAFEVWTSIRIKIADQLESNQAVAYTEYSKEVSNSIFSFIESLERPEFIPAL